MSQWVRTSAITAILLPGLSWWGPCRRTRLPLSILQAGSPRTWRSQGCVALLHYFKSKEAQAVWQASHVFPPSE